MKAERVVRGDTDDCVVVGAVGGRRGRLPRRERDADREGANQRE